MCKGMKKLYQSIMVLSVIILMLSCSTEECTMETRYYYLDDYLVAEKDSVLVAYDHQIRVDTIIDGFNTIDTTEIDDPDNLGEVLIKYDTTQINAETHLLLSNIELGLSDQVILSAGDTTYFGSDEMVNNFTQIMIIFLGLDSTKTFDSIQINQALLYQDCSQWD